MYYFENKVISYLKGKTKHLAGSIILKGDRKPFTVCFHNIN